MILVAGDAFKRGRCGPSAGACALPRAEAWRGPLRSGPARPGRKMARSLRSNRRASHRGSAAELRPLPHGPARSEERLRGGAAVAAEPGSPPGGPWLLRLARPRRPLGRAAARARLRHAPAPAAAPPLFFLRRYRIKRLNVVQCPSFSAQYSLRSRPECRDSHQSFPIGGGFGSRRATSRRPNRRLSPRRGRRRRGTRTARPPGGPERALPTPIRS